MDPYRQQSFELRWRRYEDALVAGIDAAYGTQAGELLTRVRGLLETACDSRPEKLRRLDEWRLLNPDWLAAPQMVGYTAYLDRFAGSLPGLIDKLDYLEDLGVSYLHLMPLWQPGPPPNDGGYAIADFRAVRPDLGTWEDLQRVTDELHDREMALELDVVLNHVASAHEWVSRARAGEQKYRDYFYIYPDRTEPDAFEEQLLEVFPDLAPGNFTLDEAAGGWVWTTFHEYQWDLNWSNPDVFCEYLDIICHLLNAGVDVLRLDGVSYIWKRLGTRCQNLPEVHAIVQALRAAVRIVAPGAAFKAEAMVGPKDLIAYLGRGDQYGALSDTVDHNSVMVQLWSALATRDTRLFKIALDAVPAKPPTTTWSLYARSHDDIGWAIDDQDAARAGGSGFDHRRFLANFYSGAHKGSFATGLVFQHDPMTGEERTSGTLASLCGLESAQEADDQPRLLDALARIRLLHAVILGFGGIPKLYMGDELGLTNDYSYLDDQDHAADNRWIHRPRMDWSLVADAESNPMRSAAWVRNSLRQMIEVRKATPQLHASIETQAVSSPDPRLLLLWRQHHLGDLTQVYNFSEESVWIPGYYLADLIGETALELLGNHRYDFRVAEIEIRPYQCLWFVAE